MLSESKKFTVADFEHMQYDVVCPPARRFQAIVRKSRPERNRPIVDEFLKWDGRLTADSRPGLIYELWISAVQAYVFPKEWNGRVSIDVLLRMLEEKPNPHAISEALDRTLAELESKLPHPETWKWSAAHTLMLRHPLNVANLNLPPQPRPGDGNTVNASGGQASNGASYRQILDLADWDRSVMTNTPGESGDPESKHYRDLLDDWAAGRYHPMPFTRKAVEAATEERILLQP
jgi:penicillin amidase